MQESVKIHMQEGTVYIYYLRPFIATCSFPHVYLLQLLMYTQQFCCLNYFSFQNEYMHIKPLYIYYVSYFLKQPIYRNRVLWQFPARYIIVNTVPFMLLSAIWNLHKYNNNIIFSTVWLYCDRRLSVCLFTPSLDLFLSAIHLLPTGDWALLLML